MRKIASVATACLLVAGVSSPAAAATLFTLDSPTGEMALPGSVSYDFNAAAGAGLAEFTVLGFRTLDGAKANPHWMDTFTLLLNGTPILSGSYNLGGGGANITTLQPAGSSISSSTPGFGLGGTLVGAVPLTLIDGLNTLQFRYVGAQKLSDEAWGIGQLNVSGNAVFSAAPEPSTWAMLLIGFGAVAGVMRGAKRKKVSIAYA